MEINRNAPESYRLPSDCADLLWYVVSPFGSCVATAATKREALMYADGFKIDAEDGEDDYIVIDTKGI